jgi:hypothetical protein
MEHIEFFTEIYIKIRLHMFSVPPKVNYCWISVTTIEAEALVKYLVT